MATGAPVSMIQTGAARASRLAGIAANCRRSKVWAMIGVTMRLAVAVTASGSAARRGRRAREVSHSDAPGAMTTRPSVPAKES